MLYTSASQWFGWLHVDDDYVRQDYKWEQQGQTQINLAKRIFFLVYVYQIQINVRPKTSRNMCTWISLASSCAERCVYGNNSKGSIILKGTEITAMFQIRFFYCFYLFFPSGFMKTSLPTKQTVVSMITYIPKERNKYNNGMFYCHWMLILMARHRSVQTDPALH